MSADWNDFKGAAKRIEDIDLPRIANKINVGEDELHAFIDTETRGSGFDKNGRPKMLFEPHIFYKHLRGAKRDQAIKAGLAWPKWDKSKKYPADSYPRLKRAMAIDETAALKAASWGLAQVLGENYSAAGYPTVQAMVRDMMRDEDTHLEAAVNFMVSAKIDDDLRRLAKLTRPTTPEDTVPIVRVYNGPGYAKNNYHVNFAKAHNKWRKIKDTPWSPEGKADSVVAAPIEVPIPTPKPTVVSEEDVVRQVQTLLREKGYPEIGNPDGLPGKRTRNAILAFQADNNLALSGQITDELLAQLIKAPKREVTAARENATEKDLQQEPVVNNGNWLQRIGAAILAATGLGGVLDGTGSLEDAASGVGHLRTLAETVLPLLPWLLVGSLGVGVFYFGRRVVQKHVEAYREGRAL